jgi:hypothetical protein
MSGWLAAVCSQRRLPNVLRQVSAIYPVTRYNTMADELKKVTEISSSKMFDGFNKRFKHWSSACGSDMNFSIYFPPAAASKKVPVCLSVKIPIFGVHLNVYFALVN